jgi:ABC-type polysaccharide/polyol phosphate transport system ATPase subunit
MSEIVISVENLSKSYLIGHQGPRERYRSLRDTLCLQAKNIGRRTIDTFRGRQMLQGDSVEEFWALTDVSFEIKQGEVLGVIGRNGAGKSTLLKVLSRITEPTRGRICVNGRVASLLEVGTGFHPELSGRDNIFLNGAILGMKKREIKTKFDEIVDFAGVEKFLDTPVKRYSSGMYVRLAFAVAAHLEPEILVVDEVLAVGDAEFQKKCLGKMQEVTRSEGRTIIFVSHDLNAISRLCTRCLYLKNGHNSYLGETPEAIESYRNLGENHELTWTRIKDGSSKCLRFSSISMSHQELEESIKAKFLIELESISEHPACFVAIDINDPTGGVIMQVIPTHTGFIKYDNRVSVFTLEVEANLPPLIPGNYTCTFWVGPHNTDTTDLVESVVSFVVLNSPCQGRTFPHDPRHGYVFAPSNYKINY